MLIHTLDLPLMRESVLARATREPQSDVRNEHRCEVWTAPGAACLATARELGRETWFDLGALVIFVSTDVRARAMERVT